MALKSFIARSKLFHFCFQTEQVLAEFTAIQAAGVVPDLYAYNTVLQSLGQQGDLRAMDRYFEVCNCAGDFYS
jgi:pentatricopeptide repeat protein